jgi:hypothetical protein
MDEDTGQRELPPPRSSPWPWILLVLLLVPVLTLIALAIITLGGVTAAWHTVENLAAGRLVVRPDQTSVVTQVQQLGRLETTSYTVEQVIEGGQTQGSPILDLLLGDRLLFVAHGEAYAGVDLTRLTPGDVSISPDARSITLRLPQAQILSYKLDEEQSRVYDRQTGILARGDPQLETKVRQDAERQILQTACDGGILTRANEHAQTEIRTLLQMTHFSDVRFLPSAPVEQTGCEPQG